MLPHVTVPEVILSAFTFAALVVLPLLAELKPGRRRDDEGSGEQEPDLPLAA